MRSNFASPGDSYLLRLGELVYAVSSIEWLLLGDLDRLSSSLPAGVDAAALAAKTTTNLGRALRDCVPAITDPAVQAYIAAGAAALVEIGEVQRNAVLHARPATDPFGRQRLFRWRAARADHPGDAFWIDDADLDRRIDRVATHAEELNRVRPSL